LNEQFLPDETMGYRVKMRLMKEIESLLPKINF